MTVVEWLRAAVQARWWKLPDPGRLVALTLVSMAEDRGGELVVDATGYLIAARCGISRSAARRAIAALSAAGFCEIQTREGRGGASRIAITSDGQFDIQTERVVTQSFAHGVASSTWPVDYADPGQLQVDEMVCESLADHGDRGQFISRKPASLTAISGQIASFPRARDQDLLRSPDLRSDLRSSTSRDLTHMSQLSGPAPGPGELDEDDYAMLDPANEPTPTVPPEAGPEDAPAKPAKRPRIDPAKIPDRAWTAADYLHELLLASEPGAVIGNRPWVAGMTFASGKGVVVGEGGKTGLRLSWANVIRLLHRDVLAGLRRVDPKSDDNAAWREIAQTIRWSLYEQPADRPRVIVECADSLRAKWDKIQRARRRSADDARAQARRGDGRPDPESQRAFRKANY